MTTGYLATKYGQAVASLSGKPPNSGFNGEIAHLNDNFEEIVGRSTPLARVLGQVETVASTKKAVSKPGKRSTIFTISRNLYTMGLVGGLHSNAAGALTARWRTACAPRRECPTEWSAGND
jgi:hypothetical protein